MPTAEGESWCEELKCSTNVPNLPKGKLCLDVLQWFPPNIWDQIPFSDERLFYVELCGTFKTTGSVCINTVMELPEDVNKMQRMQHLVLVMV